MDGVAVIRQQLAFVHDALERTMASCSPEALAKNLPDATISNIGSIYAHTVFSEDGIVQGMLQGTAPLFHQQGWGARLSVQMPASPGMNLEWGRAVKLELPAFQEYAQAVYQATESFVQSLSAADLTRPVRAPFGETDVAFLVNVVLVTHVPTHTGEIAALKGAQGLPGLPF
jgi:hypothetical protein